MVRPIDYSENKNNPKDKMVATCCHGVLFLGQHCRGRIFMEVG